VAVRSQASRARWVLISPLLVFAAVFVAYPVFQGVQTSFFGLTLQNPSAPWVGLANYAHLFASQTFGGAARFTILFAVLVTTVEVVLGFGLAVLVNRQFPGKRVVFSCLLLPIMIAPALLGIMFRLLLNGDIGLVPALLGKVGLTVSLFAPGSVIPLIVGLDIVQWTSFTFLVIYSGLQSFPPDLLEAAQVDCAGAWRTLTAIILPIMSPVIFAAAFLRLIDALRTFDVIYVLTGGGPGTMTTTLSIYVYKTAFTSGDFGVASAASTVILLVLIPFVPFVVRRIARPEGRAK
jgi:multiple sugar transport system permease protein